MQQRHAVVTTHVEVSGSRVPVLGEAAVRERAVRLCGVGNTACCLEQGGPNIVFEPIVGGQADVTTIVRDGCPLTDEVLQAGMDRLTTFHTPRKS